MRQHFVFYRSFYEALESLPESNQLEIYRAISGYALDGVLPSLSGVANTVFLLIKPQIDANNRKYENGKKGAEHGSKGGRPKAEENPKETPSEPLKNPKETPNANVNDNVNENINTYVSQDTPLVAAKATTCDCPQQEIISLYHEILTELPRVRVWEGQRAKNMAARWRQWMNRERQDGSLCYTDKETGLDYWERFFQYIAKSPFLMGHQGKWKASLDWIVKAENMTKIIEGHYHGKD